MNISKEEKEHIIDEINRLTNGKPLFYLKFCSCEKFARDICNGDLYGNTVEYFREKEQRSGERGQGDALELLLKFETNNIAAYDNETGELAFTAPKGSFSFQFQSDKIIPIVSFVGIEFQEINIVFADDNHTDFMLPFSEEEYNDLISKFGEYCVIISGNELERRIAAVCDANDFDYIFDKVDYCVQNRIDRVEAFQKGLKQRFLYKNDDLAYQREYRLAIGIEMPEDHFIRIGKLTSANYIEAKKLKDLYFSINYETKQKE